jgi:hypothetical protein
VYNRWYIGSYKPINAVIGLFIFSQHSRLFFSALAVISLRSPQIEKQRDQDVSAVGCHFPIARRRPRHRGLVWTGRRNTDRQTTLPPAHLLPSDVRMSLSRIRIGTKWSRALPGHSLSIRSRTPKDNMWIHSRLSRTHC